MSEYDTDKDGFISLSEFIGDVRGNGKAEIKPSMQPFRSLSRLCSVNISLFSMYIFLIRWCPFEVGDRRNSAI